MGCLPCQIPAPALFRHLGEDHVDPHAVRVQPRDFRQFGENERTPQQSVQLETGRMDRGLVFDPTFENGMSLFEQASLPEPTRQLQPGPHQIRFGLDRVREELTGQTRLGGADPLQQPRFTGRFGSRGNTCRLNTASSDGLRLLRHQICRQGHAGARRPLRDSGADLGLEIANTGRWAVDGRLQLRRHLDLPHAFERPAVGVGQPRAEARTVDFRTPRRSPPSSCLGEASLLQRPGLRHGATAFGLSRAPHRSARPAPPGPHLPAPPRAAPCRCSQLSRGMPFAAAAAKPTRRAAPIQGHRSLGRISTRRRAAAGSRDRRNRPAPREAPGRRSTTLRGRPSCGRAPVPPPRGRGRPGCGNGSTAARRPSRDRPDERRPAGRGSLSTSVQSPKVARQLNAMKRW